MVTIEPWLQVFGVHVCAAGGSGGSSSIRFTLCDSQESMRAMTAAWADTLFINVGLSLDIKSVFLARQQLRQFFN